ncbi:MAG: acetyl-CoA carboxylase biotin carboxylase subunit [Peptococcaceae bacterium]|nr:acetyl-CoA carboxylase biotin carboxylase subunit [Peptococcaceae bacterium]
MFDKILIANRGEIAVRIIRACRELNVQTVAVYSEADSEGLHVGLADSAICVGPALSSESYLNMHNVLNAALLSGAQAIHPGVGFLAENAQFAQMCAECGIKFIGPSATTIALLGDKIKAKETVRECGVPVIPGTENSIDVVKAEAFAREIGYPVMLKAAVGGGGRGIRKVRREEDMFGAYAQAQREAQSAFGDGRLYIEKLLTGIRHIEVQILADEQGNVIHLGERDCSLQRRNQKIIEETPSPALSPALREEICRMAVKAAQAAGYTNAGTVEFLLDRDGKYYFMEMNTRIQVEHPITEMVTGMDLVKEQLRVAAGDSLSRTQEDVRFCGVSMECRINAENPEQGFRPSCGRIVSVHLPGGPGVRFDSSIYTGYTMPPFYDSLLGKLIVHMPTREEALNKMRAALQELTIEGVDTNIWYQQCLLAVPEVRHGVADTSFIDSTQELLAQEMSKIGNSRFG